MDDDELTPEEAATIEAFSALLVDEAVWGEPSPGLEDLIAAQIATEAAGRGAPAAPAEPDPDPADQPSNVVPLRSGRPGRTARRNWWTLAGAAVAGAAAAALITTAVVQRNDTTTAGERVEMHGTTLAPGAEGSARLTSHPSGVRIDLAVKGLPDREGGDFYQVWLKNCAGTLLVPAGSYHNLDDAVGWVGVAIADFPVITVTTESAVGGKDPAQGSSGQIVASGMVGSCPT
jgi:hypothetical protein